MADRLLTPSTITAWLDCAHFLTLRNRLDDGLLAEPDPTCGSFARLLLAKGNQHERECLAEYARAGKSILEIPSRAPGDIHRLGCLSRQPVGRGLGRHLPDAVRP